MRILTRAIRSPAWGEWGRGADFAGTPMGGNTTAGISVTVDTATAFSIVYACLRLRAETMMSMPVDQITTQGGVRRETATRAPWLDRPNAEMLWPAFVDQLMWSMDADANAFIAPTRDSLGRAVELWPLDPCRVTVRRERPGGPRVYFVDGQRVAGEIIHLALHIPPGGDRGVGPIQKAPESIGAAIAAQQYGSTWFGNSAMPSVVIEAPGVIPVEQQKEMRASWFRHHGGTRRSNLPGLLTGGATAKVLNISPEQSQFLETRRFTMAELCMLWRVPVEVFGFGNDGLVYQNLDKVKLRLVQEGLLTPMRIIEDALSMLLPTSERVRFNPNVYLRGDTTSRYAAHATAIRAGFMTPNEARALEDLSPIEGGDDLLWPPYRAFPVADDSSAPVAAEPANGGP